MRARRDTLLLISTSYPIATDGSEAAGAFVADIAAELAERMPVRVVAPGLHAGPEKGCGMQVRRFASTGKPLSLLSPAKPWHWPAITGTLRSLRRETLMAAADGRVMHSLAFWALPSGWAALALNRRQGVPYSVWALGSDIWAFGHVPLVRGILTGVCGRARHAYADGLKLAEDASCITGRGFDFLPSTRKLEVARRQPVASVPPLRFLFLGRWHANKGIDLLLEALAQLDDESWHRISEVHIAGGGPLEGLVVEKVADMQRIGRPIRISGFLDGGQAALALAQADRLLLPSRIESIPVVFSDAMKAGLPIVSMPVGDLPALVRDGAGMMAEDVSAGAFAVAIKRMLTTAMSEDDRARLADIAGRFDISAVADRIIADVGRGGDG